MPHEAPTIPEPAPPLTLEDLRACGYQEVLSKATADDGYSTLDGLLSEAASAAKAAGRPVIARALAFLERICSMMLTPSEPAAPFQPMLFFSAGHRSFIPEDLTEHDIELIAGLVEEVENTMLRARLADLVWLKARKKGIAFAWVAIDAYRSVPIRAETWHMDGANCWHRALQLALLIGAGAQSRTGEIEKALIDAFWNSAGADDYEPLWYVRPLYANFRAKDQAERIAAKFDQLAQTRLNAGRASEAESFYSAAEQWYGRAGMADKQADMLVGAASCWAAQGAASGSEAVRHHFYSKSIAAYREVPAQFRAQHKVDETVDQLRSKLAVAGQLLLAEMQTVRGPTIDLAEIAKVAVRHVQGKSPLDALMAFCELHPTPHKAQHVEAAQALVAEHSIANLFGTTSFSGDGRAIAKRDGDDAGDAARAAQIHSEAVKSSLFTMAMTTRGMINPALDAMQLECHYTQRDFYELAHGSPLVPRDRVDIVAKALYAGYCRDYVQAIHILLPQFEHMVREALKAAGAHTTTHDARGIDMEAGLSTLVERQQMEEEFGADLTFTITALMCDQEGPNLRNVVAHGLADSRHCEGDLGIYAWWLVLRLVVRGFAAMRAGLHAAPEGSDLQG